MKQVKRGLASATIAGSVATPIGVILVGISITYTIYGLLNTTLKILGEPPLCGYDAKMKMYQEYLKLCYATVTYDDIAWNVSLSGQKIYDSLTKTEKDSMYLMCRDILTRYGDEPEIASSVIESVTAQYVRYFWTKMDRDNRAAWYAMRTMQLRDGLVHRRTPRTKEQFVQELANLSKGWTDPDNKTFNTYCRDHMDYVTKQVEGRVRAVIRDDYINKKLALKIVLQDRIVPLLNERIFFTVIDSDLKEGETFDKSELSGYKPEKQIRDYANDIMFINGKLKESTYIMKNNMLCMPSNRKKSDYSAESVQPYPRANSNVVFTCTRYHYMQMGAPGEIVIAGRMIDSEIHLPIKTIPPSSGGTVKVELVINPDFSRFTGLWIPVEIEDQYRQGKDISTEWVLALVYIPEYNIFGEFEGPARAYNSDSHWSLIRTFSYDPKKKELTVDFRANTPKGIDTAVFKINERGNLVMRNRGGNTEFFKVKEGDRQ